MVVKKFLQQYRVEKSFRQCRDRKKKARTTKCEMQKAGETGDEKNLIKKEHAVNKAKLCNAVDEILRNMR